MVFYGAITLSSRQVPIGKKRPRNHSYLLLRIIITNSFIAPVIFLLSGLRFGNLASLSQIPYGTAVSRIVLNDKK